MYVKYYMTTDMITITEDTKILEALDLMRENDLHRLPVMEGNRLIGLLTEGIIQENSPSKATSLSIHEMNYLLTKTSVGEVMIKKVITIGPDALLEEAAVLMRQHNIKCLPVLKDDQLVGIISQNDLFDAFIQVMGYYEKGCRVVVEIMEDHPGILEQMTLIFSEQKLNINQIAVYRMNDSINVVMQIASTDDEKIKAILMEKGYRVLTCTKKVS